MFAKASCENCNGHIEFDVQYAGVSIKCPHCFTNTKLIPEAPIPTPPEIKHSTTFGYNHIPEGDWVKDPASEKQKAMLMLYGINIPQGLTKGEASSLIDSAVQAGEKPTNENQTRAAELFWKIRLNELVEEINDSLKTIGDETVTITALKETKKKVKESVRNLTDVIDKRIQTIQDINRETKYQRNSEWLRQHGMM
jgi:hypothetical protein